MKYERQWDGETKWQRMGAKHLETALRQIFPGDIRAKLAAIDHGEEISTPWAVYRKTYSIGSGA